MYNRKLCIYSNKPVDKKYDMYLLNIIVLNHLLIIYYYYRAIIVINGIFVGVMFVGRLSIM